MHEFRTTQLPLWDELLSELFEVIPERCEWVNKEDIITVLNIIGRHRAENHTFLPTGGGLDLHAAQQSNENDKIEINLNSSLHVLKPTKLIFQSFSGVDSEWYYFRLETEEIEPSGIYENYSLDYEELVELTPEAYISRVHWDHNEFNGAPLDRDARLITRVFKGDFVIFSKASLYNQNTSTYDARHNSYNDEEFKSYIQTVSS